MPDLNTCTKAYSGLNQMDCGKSKGDKMTIRQGSIILYRNRKNKMFTSEVLSIDDKKDLIKTEKHKKIRRTDLVAVQRTIWDFLQ